MKKYLTLILIIYSTGIFAQSKVDYDTLGYGMLHITDENNSYVNRTIYNNGDTVITVVGDSLTAIKFLFNSWQGALNQIPRIGTFQYLRYPSKSKTLYGYAGIKKEPIDSSKYFYRRFLTEKKRGVPDSLNRFKSKLYKKNQNEK